MVIPFYYLARCGQKAVGLTLIHGNASYNGNT